MQLRSNRFRRYSCATKAASERGLALIIVLIALVIMLVSAVALIRSFDVSMTQAGNLAFKRDLKNEAERGVLAAIALLSNGELSGEIVRNEDSKQNNYSAKRLESDDNRGIPRELIDDRLYAAAGFRSKDIVDEETGVTVRYLIDRQCAGSGDIESTTCVTYSKKKTGSCDSPSCLRPVEVEKRPIYRISVRATGPRNTQVFIQTTVLR